LQSNHGDIKKNLVSKPITESIIEESTIEILKSLGWVLQQIADKQWLRKKENGNGGL